MYKNHIWTKSYQFHGLAHNLAHEGCFTLQNGPWNPINRGAHKSFGYTSKKALELKESLDDSLRAFPLKFYRFPYVSAFFVTSLKTH